MRTRLRFYAIDVMQTYVRLRTTFVTLRYVRKQNIEATVAHWMLYDFVDTLDISQIYGSSTKG